MVKFSDYGFKLSLNVNILTLKFKCFVYGLRLKVNDYIQYNF